METTPNEYHGKSNRSKEVSSRANKLAAPSPKVASPTKLTVPIVAEFLEESKKSTNNYLNFEKKSGLSDANSKFSKQP